MKCEEAREFVSALCDGETIPRSAAEHIGQCEACRTRLKEFAEMGAELRRVASLETAAEATVRDWPKTKKTMPGWLWKGRKTVRVPRSVIASLLVVIAALGSGLVILKVRAQNEGAVLMLAVAPPDGQTVQCALSLDNPKMASCETLGPRLAFAFRFIAKDGNRIEIGARLKSWGPVSDGSLVTLDSLLAGVEEHQYWFDPGEELKIPVSGLGPVVVTGTLTDHMPTLLGTGPDEPMDPKPDELRFVSPMLVQGKEILFDFVGGSAIAHGKDQGIEMYVPNDGLYHVALLPLKGAVEGRVERSRISFELNGHAYEFLLAAPVTRSEHVWILLDRSFKPPSGLEHGFITAGDESPLMAEHPGGK